MWLLSLWPYICLYQSINPLFNYISLRAFVKRNDTFIFSDLFDFWNIDQTITMDPAKGVGQLLFKTVQTFPNMTLIIIFEEEGKVVIGYDDVYNFLMSEITNRPIIAYFKHILKYVKLVFRILFIYSWLSDWYGSDKIYIFITFVII